MVDSIEYRGATIQSRESLVEDEVFEYLSAMDSHEMFDLDEIVLMPDVHPEPKSKTLVGFTMPFQGLLSPNIIGPDVGCGVLAVPISGWDENVVEDDLDRIVEDIRSVVPMSRGEYDAPERGSVSGYHLVEDFPYEEANARLEKFCELFEDPPDVIVSFLADGGYDGEWIKSLAKRTGVSLKKAINGVGTLGGGNHFIEFARENSEAVWLLVHSGSRHVGGRIFETHQNIASMSVKERAAKEFFEGLDPWLRQFVKPDVELLDPHDAYVWVTGGMGESFMKKELIRSECSGEMIDEVFEKLSVDLPEESAWDYLEGDQLYQYYIDMVFAQVYAEENRWKIAQDVMSQIPASVHREDVIDSPHNLLDFTDGIIRKGATRADMNRLGVVPFNMDDGAVIFIGDGVEEWNESVAHGAGRPFSRTKATELFEESSGAEPSVRSSGATPDEYPHAYKDSTIIRESIEESVTVTSELSPFMNIKGNK